MEWSKYNCLLSSPQGLKYIYNSLNKETFQLEDEEWTLFSQIKTGEKKISQIPKDTLDILKENYMISKSNEQDLANIKLSVQKNRLDTNTLTLGILPDPITEKTGRTIQDNMEMKKALFDYIIIHEPQRVRISWLTSNIATSYEFIKDFGNKIIFSGKNYMADIILNNDTPDFSFLKSTKDNFIVNILWNINAEDYYHSEERRKSLTQSLEQLTEEYGNIETPVTICIRAGKNEQKSIPWIYNLICEKVENIKCNIYISYENTEKPALCPSMIEMDKAIGIYEESGMPTKLNYLLSEQEGECIARKINGYIIDPEGYVYKCWKDLKNTGYAIGHITDNRIENTELFIKYMTQNDPLDKQECRQCGLMPVCISGCILDSERSRCEVLKKNMNKLIEMNLNI